jgi:hypothetical protein
VTDTVFFVVVGSSRGAVTSNTYTDSDKAQEEYAKQLERSEAVKEIKRVTLFQLSKVASWNR